MLVIGWRGWRGTLPRNRVAGVRTSATLRSDEAFALGNRVAAPATMTGGGLMVLIGLSVPMLGSTITTILVAVIGTVGSVFLVGAGGVLAHRAASAMPEPAIGGCGGCAGGCCGGA